MFHYVLAKKKKNIHATLQSIEKTKNNKLKKINGKNARYHKKFAFLRKIIMKSFFF